MESSALDHVSKALWVRRNAVNDFFGGWEEDDVALLRRLVPLEVPSPAAGEIVDWLGIRTLHSHHAWLGLEPSASAAILELPFPDDQVHAEAIEYVALAHAIDRASKHEDRAFSAIELGASYAPWAVASGVLALRAGLERISLCAVEASSSMIPCIRAHAERNGLTKEVGVEIQVVHGAITAQGGIVYFPNVAVSTDNGAQVSQSPRARDYRGLDLLYETVSGITFTELTRDISRIDFLHIDIQGAEEELLLEQGFFANVASKVSTLFLATQSRLIEGVALRQLSRLGWRVVRERPTMYRQNERTDDPNGWTLRDGRQLWLNPRFD